MMSSFDERTPLLQFPGSGYQYFGQVNSLSSNGPPLPPRTNNPTDGVLGDLYHQFCHLIGVKPVDAPPDQTFRPNPDTLYNRARKHHRHQNAIYLCTATLTNGLLMAQVVLGAALTGLGASDSSRVLITVFGALNTVIAGLVAFLKSRGQPVRARMFRDDLERVVDEIENSATMWLGISRGAHGYDAIDTDEQVTVRSEVARLTRLYDRAVKTNTMNDPDMYSAGGGLDPHSAAALRSRPVDAAGVPAVVLPVQASVDQPVAGPSAGSAPAAADPDESPASKADHAKKDDDHDDNNNATSPAAAPGTNAGDGGAVNDDNKAKDKNEGNGEASKSTDDARSAPANDTTTDGSVAKVPAQDSSPSSPPLQPPAATPAASAPIDVDASPASAAHLPSHS